jgi:hypothetical protein
MNDKEQRAKIDVLQSEIVRLALRIIKIEGRLFALEKVDSTTVIKTGKEN